MIRWIFQGNPKRFNTKNAVNDPILQNKGITWRVKENGSKMETKQTVFLYNTGGKKGGAILAKCQIISSVDVRPPDPDVQKHWTELAFEEWNGPESRVWLKILEISDLGLPYESVESISNSHGKVVGSHGKTNIQLDPSAGRKIEQMWESINRQIL